MFGLGKSPKVEKSSWTDRLKAGLSRTREAIGGTLTGLFKRGRIDEALFEDMETALLVADCGVDATRRVLEALRSRVRKEGVTDSSALKELLRAELLAVISPLQGTLQISSTRPFVIMVAGVNGAGKTTSIGKLAHYFQRQGKSVLLAAGDTFRAAAREQLEEWGSRNGVTVISQQSGDPGAVVFDAVAAAKARGIDVVIADTAGRLPTQLNLMDEIRKIKRVIGKAMPEAPHEVLLVLDANTGQNALNQVKAFDDAVGVTGLVLTKLDGTARGGVVAAIAMARAGGTGTARPLALRFIGVGEGIDDLRPFVATEFVEAMLD